MEFKTAYLKEDQTLLIELLGEIDLYDAKEMKAYLHGQIDQYESDMCINCEQLNYIDSTGIGVLLSTLKKLKSINKQLTIKNLQSHIMKVFTITGLEKVFNIEEDK